MAQTTSVGHDLQASSSNHLLSWVYYHDTMSRFTIHHWRDRSLVSIDGGENLTHPSPLKYQPVCCQEKLLEVIDNLHTHGYFIGTTDP